MNRQTGSSDLPDYWEQPSETGLKTLEQAKPSTSSTFGVMDRLETFVTASHQLEAALKKERQRTRRLEAEIAALRNQLESAQANESQLIELQAAYEALKISQVKNQHALQQVHKRDEKHLELERQNKLLRDRVISAEQRAANVEVRARELEGLVGKTQSRDAQVKQLSNENEAALAKLHEAQAQLAEISRVKEALWNELRQIQEDAQMIRDGRAAPDSQAMAGSDLVQALEQWLQAKKLGSANT